MRLWSLHPKYLDARGLVALWREALLAQAVLQGQTKGYRHHPQLARFRAHSSPEGAMADYLRAVQLEASTRGYEFASQKIGKARSSDRIRVTRGQMEYEWNHLLSKLALRDPAKRKALQLVKRRVPHPLFRIVPGGVEPWEKQERP